MPYTYQDTFCRMKPVIEHPILISFLLISDDNSVQQMNL